MGAKRQFNFTPEEYAELRMIAESPLAAARLKQRARTLLLADQDLTFREIREQGGLEAPGAELWTRRAKERKPGTSMLELLKTAPGGGRKRVITDEDRAWVKQFAAESAEKRSVPLAAKIREVCVEAGHPNLSTIVSSTLLLILKS